MMLFQHHKHKLAALAQSDMNLNAECMLQLMSDYIDAKNNLKSGNLSPNFALCRHHKKGIFPLTL